MVRNRLPALALSIVALHFGVACGGKNGDAAAFDAADGEEGGESSNPSRGGKAGTAGGTALGSSGKTNLGAGGASSEPGSGDGGADVSGDGGTNDEPGAVPPSGGMNTGGSSATGDTACSNGLDDDGDGLSDGMDPECTGFADQDEATFATGIPGDNRDPKWQDCFFDGNSGAGDDGCRYQTGCLTGDLEPSDPSCRITDECREYCQPRTPNGCDCFGCCSVEDGSGNSVDILTSGSCSVDNIADEAACPRCTKTVTCENTCGRCELCLGRSIDDLPDDCGMTEPPVGEPPPDDEPPPDGEPPPIVDPPPDIDPPPYECENGRVCSDALPCPSDSYCQLGCCLVRVF